MNLRPFVLLAASAVCLYAGGRRDISAGSVYGTIPQIADGASWRTAITLINTEKTSQKYKLVFYGDDGKPKQFDIAGRGRASTFEGTLAKGGSVVLETTGTSASLNQGWAKLDYGTDWGVAITAVFGTSGIPGRPDFEATVFGTSYDSAGFLQFDNTQGRTTSVSFLNPSGYSDVAMPITIYDEAGNVLMSDVIRLEAGHKTAFATPEKWEQTRGRRGVIRFEGSYTSFCVLGLRFNPGGAFTTVPFLDE